MKLYDDLEFESLIGSKIIIYGDIHTKKTFYTAKFVQFLLEDKQVDPKYISILDFGPKLKEINGKKIGGKIEDIYYQSVSCSNIKLDWEVIPARLTAKSKTQLWNIAEHNYLAITKALEKYLKNPTPILIINDISIYLQGGKENLLVKAIRECETFFGNTYYGNSIESEFDLTFSENEREAVERVLKKVEISCKTK